MTTIICDRYGTTWDGVKRYALNRILRIYPTYFIVLLLTVLSIILLGQDNIRGIDPNLSIPSTIKSWFMNVTLLGLDFNIQERTIPPSWTLFVELFFYVLIPLAVRLGAKLITSWLLLSIAYHAYFLFTSTDAGLDWNSRYGDIIAGSLGFALGCAARYFPINIFKFNGAFLASIFGLIVCYSIPSYFMLTGYNPAEWRYISTFGFYLTMIFSVIFIINSMNNKKSKADKFLGELSYPLYLVHIPVGFVIIKALDLHPKTFTTFIISSLFSIIVATAIHFSERSINKIRDNVRPAISKSPT
jgi:peptidoglycan/LPS O-acetylase OafA/YrhL